MLCGGESKRMKPYVPFNKALVRVRGEQSLLEYQVDWLKEHGVDRVVLAVDEQTHRRLERDRPQVLERVDCSVEEERLGTGGAVVKAVEMLGSSRFYLMNVDDIILSERYGPGDLVEVLNNHKGSMASVLLGRTRFPFGVVETSSSRVTGFRQKPVLDYDICVGHYALDMEGVEGYFPERGGFEDTALPRMAVDGVLYSRVLEGEWITINNLKQLEFAKKTLNQS